jgi:hypothetical protein
MRSRQGQLCRAGHKVTYAWQSSEANVATLRADVTPDAQQLDLRQVFAVKPRQTAVKRQPAQLQLRRHEAWLCFG